MSALRWIPLGILLLPLLAACGASPVRPSGLPGSYDQDQVPSVIEQAGRELATKDPDAIRRALGRLDVATGTRGLAPGVRAALQQQLNVAAQANLELLSRAEPSRKNARTLEAIAELELPGDLAVRLTVEAARQWLAIGERRKCYKVVRKLDERYPMHAQRRDSGALVAEAGLSLANDPGWYGFFFDYADLAPDVLEYFTTHYPEDPRGPEAYLALAGAHERGRRWSSAIIHHEDLVLYYPGSPESVESRARIPRLRLAGLASPEYDRATMALAREELDDWLAEFGGEPEHPLAEEVRLDRLDCIQRLADNDLVVARFYARVGNAPGARRHAARALEEARDGGDLLQIDEAARLLAEVAPDEAEGTAP